MGNILFIYNLPYCIQYETHYKVQHINDLDLDTDLHIQSAPVLKAAASVCTLHSDSG